ncbi:type IV pilin protein [Oceanicoccus sagamiensis]|uniref:Pilus assembly protein PilE n=1 Tax=Oceanicoccus sagamiensis TaxID=716816 RepID=A0A1X9N6Q7_9GAMM|nr:type IV pilin protein [Oceanicoccus sagamiensis]ARN72844.1 hypothetical protein BST96_01220 [Oceanicoccus sagamiensis]
MSNILQQTNTNTGFSLLEMIMVLAIIGLLTAIAIPRYESYILRSNRIGEGLPALNQLMQAQERHAAQYGSYTDKLTELGYSAEPITPGGHYKLKAVACDNTAITHCIAVQALAQGQQSKDTNGVDIDNNGEPGDLSYNSRGEKSGIH